MVFGALPTEHHEVQVLTTSFQFSGQLETIGALLGYINDANRDSFSLSDAYLTPLTPGAPMKGISRPQLTIRRPQIAFLYFASPESRAAVRMLVQKHALVVYTPVAVCRGYVHMPAEARLRDFMDVVTDEMFTISEARIFPLIELPAPFPLEADLLFVGRFQVQCYHPA